MLTLQDLERKMKVTEDLQSVVKTMKALAAVNIRQYEAAAAALKDYYRTVEMSLGIVLRKGNGGTAFLGQPGQGKTGAVIFGSDQGMAGQLNEKVVDHALAILEEKKVDPDDLVVLVVGERPRGLLDDAGIKDARFQNVPGSAKGIAPLVQDLLVGLEDWMTNPGLAELLLFYNRHVSGASFHPASRRLLPLDQVWLDRLGRQDWPSRGLPTFTMDRNALFSALIRQYLFVSIFQATAESLASENASRLAAMQNAEKNIEARMNELTGQYHQRRQMAITEELLDIVSGFEALADNKEM